MVKNWINYNDSKFRAINTISMIKVAGLSLGSMNQDINKELSIGMDILQDLALRYCKKLAWTFTSDNMRSNIPVLHLI